ncbi:MAG: hypothetical protein IJT91_07400 [Clostridia bacterium]|nr:hypothetical protein [Clostridia bacterium]
MNKRNRLIALILAILMVVPMLAACQKNGGGSGGSDDTKDNKPVTESGVLDDLGDMDDFQGETFTILCREDNMWGNFAHEIMADEDEVELVNQAVYERNINVEQRFGVTLNIDPEPGHWQQKDEFINLFKTSIMAGDGAFDFIMSQQAYMADLSLFDLYLNVYDLPNVNFDKAYYYTDVMKDTSVDGKQFFVLGDYSLTFWEYLYIMYFNKKLASNYNIPDIYEIVNKGEWTIDKCIELTKGIYRDLNGDNWPGEEDQYGYITLYENTTDVMPTQFGIESTRRDESGNLIIDVDQGKVVSMLEKMTAFYEQEDVYALNKNGFLRDNNPLDKIFREDRALFYPEEVAKAQDFRDMETDFGMVPFPKWDTAQEDYLTVSQDGYSIGVVPIDIKNHELTGAMIEALTAESSRTVIPTYNEKALTYKYSRDDESAKMLKLIREHVKVPFGDFYLGNSNVSYWTRLLLMEKNTNFVSYYAANKTGYDRTLKKIIKAFQEHE